MFISHGRLHCAIFIYVQRSDGSHKRFLKLWRIVGKTTYPVKAVWCMLIHIIHGSFARACRRHCLQKHRCDWTLGFFFPLFLISRWIIAKQWVSTNLQTHIKTYIFFSQFFSSMDETLLNNRWLTKSQPQIMNLHS